ncbi:MAG TPA: twin-arginine translocase TatA/TatE family subunit [Desulfurobacteriaceae bacterium]|nr:twin-arginine translocase TatA/TatE family subunit [Desulfurobacteriaceae bacterium]
MFNIGTNELLLILAIVLLIFGPKKLPDLARSLGRAINEFRKASSGVSDEVESIKKEVKESAKVEDTKKKEDIEKIKVKE